MLADSCKKRKVSRKYWYNPLIWHSKIPSPKTNLTPPLRSAIYVQCFKQEGRKADPYSEYCPVELWCLQDCLPFIASSKRLAVSVAVQIILPAGCRRVGFEHKPAKLNNHTILIRKWIFRSEERGTDEKKDREFHELFILLAPSHLTSKGLIKFPHLNALTKGYGYWYRKAAIISF